MNPNVPTILMRDIMINEFQRKSQSWALTIQIVKKLHSNNVNIETAIKKISSNAFGMENGRYISISSLESIFDSFPIEKRLVRELYYSMDISRSSRRFDWRIFLFMLRCTCNVTMTPREMLKEAFLFYTGGILDIDEACNSQVKLKDLHFIFKSLVRPDKAELLEDEYRRCWNERAENDINFAYRMLTTSVCVSLGIFTSIIQQMNSLDSPGFEENYYPMPLVQYLKSRRMMTTVIRNMMTKRKIRSIQIWKDVIERRRNIQITFEKVMNRYENSTFRLGFFVLMSAVIETNAAIMIQKCSLNYLSRVRKKTIKLSDESAIKIQNISRGYIVRKNYKQMLYNRFLAAVDIQKTYRGHLGHKIGKAREWIKRSERDMLIRLELEREYQYMSIQNSITIQRFFRGYRSRMKFKSEVERRIRTLKVAAEIEEQKRDYLRETLIHEEQVKFHFENVREKLRNERTILKRTDEHKKALCRLRRRLRNSERERHWDEKRRITMQRISDKQEICKRMWGNKIEIKRSDFKEYCRSCIRKQGSSEDRIFGKNLRNMIKDRVKDVLERSDARGMKMEFKEAREIAQEEIIEIMTLKEIDQMHRHMEHELETIEAIELKEFERVEAEDREQAVSQASHLLVSSIRRWRARRELFRRCSESFEKLFDEKYKAFYYRNIRTGQVMWKKPKALGKLDLKVQEQYKEWL